MHVALVANYFPRVIPVEHLKILAMFQNLAMARRYRYEVVRHIISHLSFVTSSVQTMILMLMVRHVMRMVVHVFMVSVLVHNNNVLIFGEQVEFLI